MTNWKGTEIKCENPEVVKECAALLAEDDPLVYEGYRKDDATLHIGVVGEWVHEKIKTVSRLFPEDVLECKYSVDAYMFPDIYKAIYKNGRNRVIDVDPAYSFTNIPLDSEKDRKAIYQKVSAFCKRIDVLVDPESGEPFIDRVQEEVRYKFEYDGENGKKYQITAIKKVMDIEFKVYEGIIRYDWREVEKDKRCSRCECENSGSIV